MGILRHLTVASAIAFAVVPALASGGIGPGDAAPKLEIKTWLKGKEFKEFEAGKIYVVEFWATWCGPCLQSIPHLTELAKKNTDVTFLGVGIWEEQVGDNLKKFVADMGDKMDYNVAYSGNQDGMAVSWMKAAGQNGIPSAFIIKDKTIMWVGHPMSMDEPLAKIKSGDWDVKKERAEFEKRGEASKKAQAAQAELRKASALWKEGKRDEAKAQLEKVVAENPQFEPASKMIKFGWMADENPTAWKAEVVKLSKSSDRQDRMTVLDFALNDCLGDKNSKAENGFFALNEAVKNAPKDDVYPNYYAAVIYFNRSVKKDALNHINKAIEIGNSSNQPQHLKEALANLKADIEKLK